MIRVGTVFSGIGAPEQAFENLQIAHSIEWACDIDAKCKETYYLNHSPKQWYDDINKIDISQLSPIDFYWFSFPCFPANELVLTRNGFVPIKNIQSGDFVLSHTNTYQKVLKSAPTGIKSLYKIVATGILPFKTTADHPLYVRKRKGIELGPAQFKPVSSLVIKEDYLGIAVNSIEELPKYEGSLCETSYGHSRLLKTLPLNDPNFWWFVGRYLADGWFVDYNDNQSEKSRCKKVFLCCAHKEKEEVESRLKLLPFHFTHSPEETTDKFHFTNRELFNYMVQFGRYCHGKHLTQDILNLPLNLLESFLDGFISGDGCFDSRMECYRLSSISKELILGLQHCIHKVYKVPTTIYVNNRKPTTVICGRTVNQTTSYEVRFGFNKHTRGFYEDGYIWQPLNKVEALLIQEEVYNLQVEQDNSFTVNNCIVHNCTDVSPEGKLDLTNGESALVHKALEILDHLLPKYMIFENVMGLTWPRFKDFYEAIKSRIKHNYNFHLYSLDARNFGLPQSRPRVFGVGARKDLKQKIDDFAFEYSTSHLSEILEENIPNKYWLSKERSELIIKNTLEKQPGFVLEDKLGEVKHTRSNSYRPQKKIRYEGCSFCLTASCTHGIITPDYRIRHFTPRECARLMGFPDSFKHHQYDSYAYNQFGNSVAVPVIEQLLLNLL